MPAIKKVKSTRTPQRVVILDTESTAYPDPDFPSTQLHVFRIGCAALWEWHHTLYRLADEQTFCEPDHFWEWLASRLTTKQETWVISHNLPWDLTELLFWAALQNGYFTLQRPVRRPDRPDEYYIPAKPQRGRIILGDPPNVVTVFDNRGRKVVLCDSFNWFRCGLAELGQSVGMAKLPLPEQGEPQEVWEEYCRRDVRILSMCVIELMTWWKKERLGAFKPTIGGLAMAAYQARFMTVKHYPVLNRVAQAMGRLAYFGGEAFTNFWGTCRDCGGANTAAPEGELRGGRPYWRTAVHAWDVTSAYASVMRDRPYPGKLHGSYVRPHLAEMEFLLDHYPAVALVRLESPVHRFPVKVDTETVFARGRFWTILTSPDLLFALRSGALKEVELAYAYEPVYPFKAYVDYFFSIKRGAAWMQDHVKEMLAKCFLVSLYGKFGQTGERWEDDPSIAAPVSYGHFTTWRPGAVRPLLCRAVGWNTQVFRGRADLDSSNPLICAFVTAYLRRQMWIWRNIVGESEVIYQDTDGLHLTDFGHQRMKKHAGERTHELGEMVHKCSWENVQYYGVRDYVADGVPSIAGLPSGSFRIADRVYQGRVFQRAGSLIDLGPADKVAVTTTTISLPDGHVHGRIRGDGSVEHHRIHRPGITDDIRDALWPKKMTDQDPDQEREDRLALRDRVKNGGNGPGPVAANADDGIVHDAKDHNREEDKNGSRSDHE